MALASLEDINIHLPEDKIEVDSARYPLVQLDAERVVRGYLSGYVDASILATWATPDTTPETVRAIAGRLCAFFWYAERYSEDSLDVPTYALFKYNEAISWLTQIREGTIILEDVPVNAGINIEEGDFLPNNSTPGPYFTMDMNI